MKIDKYLKTKVNGLLDLTDLLSKEIEESRKELTTYFNKIVEKDSKGEDATDEILEHRYLLTYSMLLNEDLVTQIHNLSIYKEVSDILELDLELSKEDNEKLSFISGRERSYFGLHKGKLVSKELELEKTIRTRLEANIDEIKEGFLKSLRENKEYINKRG